VVAPGLIIFGTRVPNVHMSETLAIGELHSRAVVEATSAADLHAGDRVVLVAREADYSADHRFPIYTVDAAGSAGDGAPDFQMFRVYKLPK
jgi:hypothetical protein